MSFIDQFLNIILAKMSVPCVIERLDVTGRLEFGDSYEPRRLVLSRSLATVTTRTGLIDLRLDVLDVLL